MEVVLIKGVYYFEFNDGTFVDVRDNLIAQIREFINKGIKFSFLNPIPPCIVGKKLSDKSIKDNQSSVYISDNKKVINTNIRYNKIKDGKNCIFNVLRMKSGQMSNKCLKCILFRDNRCSGFFNYNFLKDKKLLEKKYSERVYKAISKAFDEGFLMFGSVCKNNKCKFCYQRYLPPNMIPTVPFLSVEEIDHFSNYFNERFIENIGAHPYCASGEFLDHPNWFEILDKKRIFLHKYSTIITNALQLNKSSIENIKDLDIELSISAHTLDIKKRKEIMGYNFDFDIKKLFDDLDEVGVRYNVWFTLLKSNFSNGILEKEIRYLIENNDVGYVYINTPISSKFIPSFSMKKELDVPYNEVVKLYKGLAANYPSKVDIQLINFDKIGLFFRDIYDKLSNYKLEVPKILFHTKMVKSFLDDLPFDKINVSLKELVPYDFGDESTGCAEGITVNDLIKNINNNLNDVSKETLLIFPYAIFNDDLNDYSLNSINKLIEHLDNDILIIRFNRGNMQR